MKVPDGLRVGVCSHTGLQRGSNEDDYLLVATGAEGAVRAGLLVAIADGMGGVAGGAEASRTALRGLGAGLLEQVRGIRNAAAGGDDEPLRRGFLAADARVREASSAVPALRDMGTTLTALWLQDGGGAAFGHVGDSRLYRLRAGSLRTLTEDHAAEGDEHLLTRCVGGGGRADVEIDHQQLDVRGGDRFLLATDGIWNVVGDTSLGELVRTVRSPQSLAERLVQAALDAGGPDNATAVVVDVERLAFGAAVECELPRDERPGARFGWPAARPLRTHPMVWVALLLAAGLLAWAVAAAAGVRAIAPS